MSESTYARAFSVLRYRDRLPLEGPPVLNSYSTPFSFSRFPASPHQSSNRPPSVQFDPLDPPFSAIMTAYIGHEFRHAWRVDGSERKGNTEAFSRLQTKSAVSKIASRPHRYPSDFRAFPSSRVVAWMAQTPRSGVCCQSEEYSARGEQYFRLERERVRESFRPELFPCAPGTCQRQV